MSYPKKPPAIQKDKEKEIKLSQKKEQLKSLLINKFRGKYKVTAEVDDFDGVIKEQVATFL